MITCPTCDGGGGPSDERCPETGYPDDVCHECRGTGLVPHPLAGTRITHESCDADLHRAVELGGGAFTWEDARSYRYELQEADAKAQEEEDARQRIERIAYVRGGRPW